ncbi:MAG: hypothetical protein KGI67_09400 [Pseudomonadota bacterium]|nr:hypothetical protein [Pseudomonadota bacterium]
MASLLGQGSPLTLVAMHADRIGIMAVTEPELRFGVEVLPSGNRRDALAAEIAGMIAVDFADRILPVDSAAAIARSRGAGLATRNVADFDRCGLDIVNPWRAATGRLQASAITVVTWHTAHHVRRRRVSATLTWLARPRT